MSQRSKIFLFLGMFVRKKRTPSGVVSVQVIDKSSGRYVVRKTIGSSNDVFQIEQLVSKAHQWIKDQTGQEILDFTNYEELTRTVLDGISGITISGCGIAVRPYIRSDRV